MLAEDTDGRMVNVEMQVSEDKDHQKRARYYQASMDMSFLEKLLSAIIVRKIYRGNVCW